MKLYGRCGKRRHDFPLLALLRCTGGSNSAFSERICARKSRSAVVVPEIEVTKRGLLVQAKPTVKMGQILHFAVSTANAN